jgi:hypothetical protein
MSPQDIYYASASFASYPSNSASIENCGNGWNTSIGQVQRICLEGATGEAAEQHGINFIEGGSEMVSKNELPRSSLTLVAC